MPTRGHAPQRHPKRPERLGTNWVTAVRSLNQALSKLNRSPEFPGAVISAIETGEALQPALLVLLLHPRTLDWIEPYIGRLVVLVASEPDNHFGLLLDTLRTVGLRVKLEGGLEKRLYKEASEILPLADEMEIYHLSSMLSILAPSFHQRFLEDLKRSRHPEHIEAYSYLRQHPHPPGSPSYNEEQP